MKFKTAFNRDSKSIMTVSTIKNYEPSKVEASLSPSTDIHAIYDNYVMSRQLPLNGRQPLYDENFVKYDSLIEAQKLCAEASEYFYGLPSAVKNQYGNDLGKFVKALNSRDDFLVQQGVLRLKSVEPIKDNTNVSEPVQKPAESQPDTATAD